MLSFRKHHIYPNKSPPLCKMQGYGSFNRKYTLKNVSVTALQNIVIVKINGCFLMCQEMLNLS